MPPQALHRGGLQLFSDTSQQCKDLFGKSPSAIIVTRPDTDLQFLKLLEDKEHLLHRLAVRDLEQRTLSPDTRAAVLNLGDINKRIQRRVLQEILDRCMFLLYHSQKHTRVAAQISWDELLKLAAAEILNLDISPLVLKRFGLTERAIEDFAEKANGLGGPCNAASGGRAGPCG